MPGHFAGLGAFTATAGHAVGLPAVRRHHRGRTRRRRTRRADRAALPVSAWWPVPRPGDAGVHVDAPEHVVRRVLVDGVERGVWTCPAVDRVDRLRRRPCVLLFGSRCSPYAGSRWCCCGGARRASTSPRCGGARSRRQPWGRRPDPSEGGGLRGVHGDRRAKRRAVLAWSYLETARVDDFNAIQGLFWVLLVVTLGHRSDRGRSPECRHGVRAVAALAGF